VDTVVESVGGSDGGAVNRNGSVSAGMGHVDAKSLKPLGPTVLMAPGVTDLLLLQVRFCLLLQFVVMFCSNFFPPTNNNPPVS
jgi:hypothetical protein